MNRKGIILAGGTGSRLLPATKAVSKQLIPLYDKPMIYYPLTTLMLSGLRDFLIITTSEEKNLFKKLLGNGSQWGLNFSYEVQRKPEGLVQSFLIGEEFLKGSKPVLILGDNFFHGQNLVRDLTGCFDQDFGATIFAYPVSNPKQYGVVEFDDKGLALNIEEKPINPKSNYAITGIYFYDETVIEKSKSVKASIRGELEITDLNKLYLMEKTLHVKILSRGMAWLDTGSCEAMHDASSYIRTIENRQGMKVGCPEEIAWRKGWINDEELIGLSKPLLKSGYGSYLQELIINKKKF